MTAITAQALADYITQNGAGISYTSPGTTDTRTLLAWTQAGSVMDVRGALFDLSLWPNMFTVPVDSVPRAEVWRRFALATPMAEIAAETKNDIDRILDGQENFPIGNESAYGAMLAAIPNSQAYQPLIIAFVAMASRPASFGEYHNVSDEAINVAIAIIANA